MFFKEKTSVTQESVNSSLSERLRLAIDEITRSEQASETTTPYQAQKIQDYKLLTNEADAFIKATPATLVSSMHFEDQLKVIEKPTVEKLNTQLKKLIPAFSSISSESDYAFNSDLYARRSGSPQTVARYSPIAKS